MVGYVVQRITMLLSNVVFFIIHQWKQWVLVCIKDMHVYGFVKKKIHIQPFHKYYYPMLIMLTDL
jgi:hypothetical protein